MLYQCLEGIWQNFDRQLRVGCIYESLFWQLRSANCRSYVMCIRVIFGVVRYTLSSFLPLTGWLPILWRFIFFYRKCTYNRLFLSGKAFSGIPGTPGSLSLNWAFDGALLYKCLFADQQENIDSRDYGTLRPPLSLQTSARVPGTPGILILKLIPGKKISNLMN